MNAPPKKVRAFTLVELMLSMAIMSLIGLTVGSVAATLSHAQSHADEMYDSVQSGRTGMGAIETYVRKAKLVTAADPDALAVWSGDANGDGEINIDEMATIQYGSQAKEVRLCRVAFPPGLPDSMVEILNAPKDLSELNTIDDVCGEQDRGAYAGYKSEVVLATDVTNFEVVTEVKPPHSRLVLLRMKVGDSCDRAITLISSAKVRAADVVEFETDGR